MEDQIDTSRIRFIVGAHFPTSSLVVSYAACRSRRSCARVGRGAAKDSTFVDASMRAVFPRLTSFNSELSSGFKRSSKLSLSNGATKMRYAKDSQQAWSEVGAYHPGHLG